MSTRRIFEPVTTMVSRDWPLVFGLVCASCANAATEPTEATAPSDNARRTADDNLFTSSLITLSKHVRLFVRISGQVLSMRTTRGFHLPSSGTLRHRRYAPKPQVEA